MRSLPFLTPVDRVASDHAGLAPCNAPSVLSANAGPRRADTKASAAPRGKWEKREARRDMVEISDASEGLGGSGDVVQVGQVADLGQS